MGCHQTHPNKMLGLSVISFYFTLMFLFPESNASMMEVTTYLYGSAELPCTCDFVSGPESLYVMWQKRENLKERGLVVHSFRDGADHWEAQNQMYRGRTELSRDLSRGKLDLKLRDVTFSDEGIYYCRAANLKDRGDIPIRLSIDRLNAKKPSVTSVNNYGKRRLKCATSGVFRKPQVEWMAELDNRKMEDLSSFGSLSVTSLSDGTMRVESVLEYEVQRGVHYLCHVKEGRLRKTARAVI
ncbi:V-set domain containing T-cell activation inhibitor 1-like [Discoglossus pictus]